MKIKFLQKILLGLSLFALGGVLLAGCSKDGDPAVDPTQKEADVFMLDGVTYDINLSYLSFGTIDQPDYKVNIGDILITGGHGVSIATLNLPVVFAWGDDIDGTYNGLAELATPGKILGSAGYSIQHGSDLTIGNTPNGYIKVTHHQGVEYTVEFDLVFADGVKASGKIRRDFPKP